MTNATSATEWVTGRVTVLKTGRAVGVAVGVGVDTVAVVAVDLARQGVEGEGCCSGRCWKIWQI